MSRLTFNEGRHTYTLDGHPAPSVTGVLGAAIAKPALSYAAARETAVWAAVNARALVEKEVPESAWLRDAQGAHKDVWGISRDNGTMLHALVMDLINGDPMPLEVRKGREVIAVPDTVRSMAEQAARFMDAWLATPVAVESLMFHETYGYAGRWDLVADLGGDRWLLDYKTGKAVYPEVALQLNAYANGTHYVNADGDDVPISDLGITRAGVVWVTEGNWELVPVDLSAAEFRTFACALEVYRWTKAPDGRHVHEPLERPESAA